MIITRRSSKGQEMNIVEYALEQVDNEAFPVDRKINAFEINEIRRIAEEKAKGMPGSTEGNIAFALIGEAFKYGFWHGWKHCEVERPDIEDFDSDDLPEKSKE